MTAYVSAVRFLGWLAVFCIFMVAAVSAITYQDWCPTGVNPVTCTSESVSPLAP